MKRSSIRSILQQQPCGRVCVAGRLVAILGPGRDALLRDETDTVLITGEGSRLPPEGSIVRITARWAAPGSLLDVTWLEVQPPKRPFGRACSDFVQTQARAENVRRRAELVRTVREFFDAAGFLEVETPIVVPSPGLDVHLDALPVQTRAGERYLITSPEYQMKRLLTGGLERIYQITKCFRNDEVGERHQPEFTMLEWYRAYSGVEEVMRDTEELVAHVAQQARRLWHGDDLLQPDRTFLYTSAGKVDVTPPWPRLTVREAFARYAGVSMEEALEDEEGFYRLLVERVEPALAGLGAVFLCEYPASMASLARKKPDDPSVAERFEAYVAGIELCNGFGELTDPAEQRARLLRDQAERRALGLRVYPIDEAFLAALEEGMPPSGGNALGLDRLIMLALGQAQIEAVIAVPASRL